MKTDKTKITAIICGTVLILTLIIVLSIFIASNPDLGKGVASFFLGGIITIQPYIISKLKSWLGGEKNENVNQNTNESNSNISKK